MKAVGGAYLHEFGCKTHIWRITQEAEEGALLKRQMA